MQVFELTQPGTWLEGFSDEIEHEVMVLLHALEFALADAAVSLGFFEREHAALADRMKQRREGWEQARASEADLAARYVSELDPNLRWPERAPQEVEARDRAIVDARRERWRSGDLPDTYANRLPFLYAKSCIYALDTIGKVIKILAQIPEVPKDVAKAHEDFKRRFPVLVQLRDSAHHVEDRIRGRYRNTPITPKPILTESIHAPEGGGIVVEMLSNNKFGGTLADGSYGEMAISADTVANAQQVIQRVFDAFSWSGSAQHWPL